MSLIGHLRHRVAIANPTRVPDGDGGYTDTWVAASPSPVWARIETATASNIERLIGNTITAPVSHIVTIRWHEDVTARSRLTYDGRSFNVRGVQNIQERDRWLVLACEEQTT
jgi:SPP1 family predicted phage head-tail adaptor